MNTSIVANPSVAASAASSSNVIETTQQEIVNLRAKLALAEEAVAHEMTLAAERAKNARREAIGSIPTLLGVDNLQQALDLIRAETPVNPDKQRLPQSTLNHARVMLAAGATALEVSKALKMGLSTVQLYKHKWGLTKPTTARRRVQAKVGNHLSPETRVAIWDQMQEKGARVAVVARKHGTSRQSVYAVLAKGRAKS